MKHMIRHFAIIALIGIFLFAAACSGLGLGTKQPEPLPLQGRYMDFEDVQVPSILKLDNESSFVYETDNLRAGVLGLTGKMKLAEALEYFETNMPRDGWAKLSSFKFRKNILIFTKPEKVCLIIGTHPTGGERMKLEVWVSPTQPGQSVGTGFQLPDRKLHEETIVDSKESS